MLMHLLISGRIKELLEAQLNVPISKQELRGWVNKNDRNMSNEVRHYLDSRHYFAQRVIIGLPLGLENLGLKN